MRVSLKLTSVCLWGAKALLSLARGFFKGIQRSLAPSAAWPTKCAWPTHQIIANCGLDMQNIFLDRKVPKNLLGKVNILYIVTLISTLTLYILGTFFILVLSSLPDDVLVISIYAELFLLCFSLVNLLSLLLFCWCRHYAALKSLLFFILVYLLI